MRFDIITIFPGFFGGFFEHGIVRRAQAEGRVTVNVHDLREFTHDRHRTVDDRPFGGGEGMVLKAGPLAEALESLGIATRAERAMRSPTLSTERHPTDEDLSAVAPGSRKDGAREDEATPIVPEAVPSAGPPQDDNSELATRVILLSAQGQTFTQAVAR